jgi:hypothetical protein
MKKILLSLFIATSLFGFTPITKTAHSKVTTSVACKYGQCQATAKSTGKQCLHCVSKEGDSYCYQHK